MELKKQLSLLDIFCFASGAMISSGLFILPGLAFAQAGPAVFISYLLAGLLAMAGLLSIGEMATAMPRAGGDYFFISRTMGAAVGTVAGLLTWFSLSMKSAWALVGMSAFTSLVINIDMRLVAIGLCVLFLGVNTIGVRESSRFQVMLVGVLLSVMMLYLVYGVRAVDVERFVPLAPQGTRAIFSTAGFVFVAFGGLLNITSISEEVREYRKIPIGLILSYLVVTALYVAMTFVTVGVLDPDILSGSLTPISDGAAAFMDRPGVILLSLAAIAAFVSTANAGILAASRYLLALSRDGLLPASAGQVNRRFQTPHKAIAITGAVMIMALFLDLEVLVRAASTVLIMPFILACAAVIIFRESRLENYHPTFRAPFYPWIQVAGIIGCSLLLRDMGGDALSIAALFILAGFLIYFFYGRRQARREHAFLHVVERLTSLDLSNGMLESELKEIIREKDALCLDRFDSIVEKCLIADIDQPLDRASLFTLAAGELARRHGLDAADFAARLETRENEASTIVFPGVAIPHLVVPGRALFDMFVARCRPGVTFRQGEPPVTAVFILCGSPDERNFHLKALSAVAQIIQNNDFGSRWSNARNSEALRHILLLAERTRHCAWPAGRRR